MSDTTKLTEDGPIKLHDNGDGTFSDQPYTSLGTLIAGEDLANNRMLTRRPATYINGSTSQVVKSGSGVFAGFIVNSHTSGTLKFWDNTAASGSVLLNTITLPSGPGFYVFPVDISFGTGLYVTVGGTIDYTILYG